MLGAALAVMGYLLPALFLLSLAALVFFVILPGYLAGDRLGPCVWCVAVGMGYAVLGAGATRMAARALVTRGHGHLQIDALAMLERDRRSPLLYLRSFDDDGVPDITGSKLQSGPTLTVELSLARALHRVGPLVSIGRPGEELPTLGTHRFYVSDEDWKPAVQHFLEIARAVVIVVGSSPGVEWEIEAALARREKVVFIFPYIVPESWRSWWKLGWEVVRTWRSDRLTKELLREVLEEHRARYVAFRDRMSERHGIELPEDLKSSVAIDFVDPETPRLLTAIQPVGRPRDRDEQGVTFDYARTLRPFVDRLEGRETKPDALERTFARTGLLSGLAWLFVALTGLSLASVPLTIAIGLPLALLLVAGLGFLVFSNLAYFTYRLVRRNRAQERREAL